MKLTILLSTVCIADDCYTAEQVKAARINLVDCKDESQTLLKNIAETNAVNILKLWNLVANMTKGI